MNETQTPGRTEPEDRQMVVFKLGKESYGVDIFRVNEIIRMREITPIPRTDSHIRGLVNLRGNTIPVVDLRVRLNLPPDVETDLTRIIVVETESGKVGVIVDTVTEVVSLEGDSIEAPPTLVEGGDGEFVKGVAKREDCLITLLDLGRALAA